MRVTRFELVYPLWKSGVLPLNDTRVAKDVILETNGTISVIHRSLA